METDQELESSEVFFILKLKSVRISEDPESGRAQYLLQACSPNSRSPKMGGADEKLRENNISLKGMSRQF